MLLSTGNLLANDFGKVKPIKKMSTQIAEMLNEKGFVIERDSELTALIRFTINNKGEIVVMSVATKSNVFEGFVKSKLNYKKVEFKTPKEGKIFTIPVRVQG